MGEDQSCSGWPLSPPSSPLLEWLEVWGKTRHRIALSGQVHHEVRKEVPGMAFESVGTIIPRDAHAYSNAYGARRSLVSITFDREAGEMSRSRVNA